MRLFSKKLYDLLLYIAVLMILASLPFYKNEVAIHVHDTKFIISITHFALFFGLIMIMFWLIYRYTWRHLWKEKLGSVCAIITILLLIGIIVTPVVTYNFKADDMLQRSQQLQRGALILQGLLIALGVMQVLLFVNVIIGILKSTDVG